MRSTATKMMFLVFATTLVLTTAWIAPSSAGLRVEMVYSSAPVDVRVWLDKGPGNNTYYDEYYDDAGYAYDVYPSADDVVLFVRASRSCYTTVYVIDTEGFLHVVHPLSPADDAFLVGGRVYRFDLRDYGFHDGYFGRGVAFAYAVSSPVPFSYASYGMGVFGPRIGFQIYGDPFVASKLFYISILPSGCRRGHVAVSYARFYVREYVRYPGYLCLGWDQHHGVRSYCRGQCAAHRHYRVHTRDPYRVLRPTHEVRGEYVEYTRINRTGAKDINDVRVRDPRGDERRKPSYPKDRKFRESQTVRRQVRPIEGKKPMVAHNNSSESKRVVRRSTTVKPVNQSDAVRKNRVVRSSRDTFIKSKENSAKIRKQLESKDAVKQSNSKREPARSKKVEKKPAHKSAPGDIVRNESSTVKKTTSKRRTKS